MGVIRQASTKEKKKKDKTRRKENTVVPTTAFACIPFPCVSIGQHLLKWESSTIFKNLKQQM